MTGEICCAFIDYQIDIFFADLITTANTNMIESTTDPITTGLPGSYGENIFENKVVVVTVGIAGSVIGILFVFSVIMITLKYRKRNDDREKCNSQNDDAFSDLPNWVKFFDNNRPTLYRGSWTPYPPKSLSSLDNLTYVQSESNRRDESMFNYRV